MKQDWMTMSHDDKKNFVSRNLDSSASQIAAMVSGASRNAIIGFCHRNKLQLGRGQKATHAAKPTQAAQAAQFARDLERRAAAAAAAEKAAEKPKRTRAPKKKETPVEAAGFEVDPTVIRDEGPKTAKLKFAPLMDDDDASDTYETFEEVMAKVIHLPVSILNLTEQNCKWPLNHTYIGVPVDKMMFCGKPKDLSRPWCNHHASLAFGGMYSGGKVKWKEGEGPQERKVMKQSVFNCRG